MKYKKGQRIWCRIYSGINDREMIYCGPAKVVDPDFPSMEVVCPVRIEHLGGVWEVGEILYIKKEDIDHEI